MSLRRSPVLLPALGAYAFATTLHFLHNGYSLEQYPNMPEWISRADVFVALALVHLVGLVGCALLYFGASTVGYVVLGAYAALGFDGLAHYSLDTFTRHTATMNFTILFEVLTVAVLFVAVIVQAVGRKPRGVGNETVSQLRAFEQLAKERGCASIYRETCSFQSPALYKRLGYEIRYERTGDPHGITKLHMEKRLADSGTAG